MVQGEIEPNPRCVRCGRPVGSSGMPDVCPDCKREADILISKVGFRALISICWMQGWSTLRILREIRGQCLRTLQVVYDLEGKTRNKSKCLSSP